MQDGEVLGRRWRDKTASEGAIVINEPVGILSTEKILALRGAFVGLYFCITGFC
jgi:hypothetical protein